MTQADEARARAQVRPGFWLDRFIYRHDGRSLPPRRGPVLAAVSALVLVALALTACRPLYIPPVPAREATPQVTRLGDASALQLEGGRPVLHVVLADIPEAGWLDVQWFAPDGTQAASDSVWVAPADVGEGRTLALPARVSPSAGEWRAVASLRGRVLRQFRLDVPPASGSGGGTP